MSLTSAVNVLPKKATVVSILGLGTATPKHSIAQHEAAIVAQELGLSLRWRDALPALYRRSGVQRRGSVLLGPDDLPLAERQSFFRPSCGAELFGPTTSERMQVFAEQAGPLLEQACARAIRTALIAESNITHLVTVSCTGFFAPGVDVALIQSLGLDSNIQRTHIGFMGCHGALNAIRTAKAIVEADSTAIVLVGAIELCSLHQQYTDEAQQLVANALFADGAASLIVGAKSEDLDVIDHELVEFDSVDQANWTIASTFSKWIPNTTDMMSWTIGNHGFRMSLDPQVPAYIEGNLELELRTWLNSQGFEIADIDAWAIHPGGPRIIQATGKALGLSLESLQPSQEILANHGNMSSPTVLFILERLAMEKLDARSCVLLAFGPGLCIEAVLLKSKSAFI